jgi:hypothetical protein
LVMRHALRLEFDVRGPMREAAKQCEADVFLKWYGNTRHELNAEYGPYRRSSVFLALIDAQDRVVGTCRLILPGPAGLKTLTDLTKEPWGLDGVGSAMAAGLDLDKTWDIATLGVRDGLSGYGRMAAAALYHGLILATRANQVSSLVSILDERVRSLLRSLGVATHALPGAGTRPYLGSAASTPVYGHMARSLDAWRRVAPDSYRLIAMGTGLDSVSVPALAAFGLRPNRLSSIDLTDPLPAVPSALLGADVT